MKHQIDFQYWRNISLAKIMASLVSLSILLLFLVKSSGSSTGSLPPGLPQVSMDPSGKPNLSFSVELPPAKGPVPDLTLNYSGSTENGFLGVGWDIPSIHFIKRDPSFGINFTSTDHYYSSLGGKMVPVAGGFRFEPDGNVHLVGEGDCGGSFCRFTATTESGIRYIFGYLETEDKSSNARFMHKGTNTVRFWMLREVRDLHGNGYMVNYEVEGDGTDIRPKSVIYNIKDGLFPGANPNLRTVQFSYENKQTGEMKESYLDALPANPIPLLSRKRLKQLSVFIGSPGSSVFSTYQFSYENSPTTGKSRLLSAQKSGFDPVQFTYTNGVLTNGTNFAGTEIRENAPQTYSLRVSVPYPGAVDPLGNEITQNTCAAGYFACYMNWNRVPCSSMSPPFPAGCVEPTTYNTYKTSCEAFWGTFAGKQTGFPYWDKCMAGFPMVMTNWQLGDIDGDGKLEILSLLGTESQRPFLAWEPYNPAKNFRFETTRLHKSPTATDSSLFSVSPHLSDELHQNSYWEFADVNGDGQMDLVYASEGNTLRVLFSNGSNLGAEVDTGIPANIGSISFNKTAQMDWSPYKPPKPMFFMGDINGDGKADFVKIENVTEDNVTKPKLIYHPSPLSRLSVNRQDFTPHGAAVDSDQKFLVDMDGDSRAELVEYGEGKLYITYFSSNLSSLETKEIPVPSFTRANGWLADVNGDGLLDFVTIDNQKNIITYLNTHNRESFLTTHSGQFPSAFYNNDPLHPQRLDFKARAFADVNGDGMSDFVYHDGTKTHVALSNGKTFIETFAFDSDPFFTVADINRDGKADFLFTKDSGHGMGSYIVKFAPADPKGSDLLEKVYRTGNIPQSATIFYKQREKFPSAFDKTEKKYEKRGVLYPDFVVEKTSVDFGEGYTQEYEYNYGPMYFKNGDPNSRANLGISWFESKDLTLGQTRRMEFYIEDTQPMLTGMVKNDTTYNSKNEVVTSTTNNYVEINEQSGTVITRRIGARLNSTSTTLYLGGQVSRSSTKSYTYDASGNILTETFTSGSENLVTEITYDNSKPAGILNRVLSKVVKSGGNVIARQEFVYDSNHNLIKDIKYRTGSDLSTVTYGMYDEYGNPGLVTDANGNSMYYVYDNRIKMLPIQVIYMNGSYQEKTYDYATGKLLTESVLIGPTSQFQTNPIKVSQYDSYGRILSITYAGQNAPNELYTYNSSNNSVTKTIKDPSGLDVSSTVFYNSIGKPIKVVSQAPSGKTITSEKTYSVDGRVLTEIPDYISTTDQYPITYSYNENLYVSKIQNPAQKKTVTFSYVGNTKTVTDSTQYVDPNGGGLKNSVATATEVYSLSGKLLEKTVSGGSNSSTTRYTYYPNGLKKTVSIGGGSNLLTTSYTYDMVGNNLSQTSPNTGTSTYTYYPNGVLHTKTDARGKTTTYSYDNLSRVTMVAKPDGEIPEQFRYDENGFYGRLTTRIDESGTTHMKYDLLGQMTEKRYFTDTQDYPITAPSLSLKFQYQYDLFGRIKSITYPEGSKARNSYDPYSGHLTSVSMDSHDGTTVDYPVVTYGLDVSNVQHRITRVTANNVQTSISFDPVFKRANRYTTVGGIGTEQDVSLQYDAMGNIVKINDFINTAYTQTFVYDDLGRMVSSKRAKDATEDIYVYNETGGMTQKGNITLQYSGFPSSGVKTALVNGSGGVNNTFTYSYDASGNMIYRQSDTSTDEMQYDSQGKMKQITASDGSITRYVYASTGERRKKVLRDGTQVFEFEGLFEAVIKPGYSPEYTVYFRGYNGELVGQFQRPGTALLVAVNDTPKSMQETVHEIAALPAHYLLKGYIKILNHFVMEKTVFLPEGASRVSFILLGEGNSFSGNFKLFLLVLTLLLLYYLGFGSQKFSESLKNRFSLKYRFVSPVLLLSIIFAFSEGCSNKSLAPMGDAPWIAIASGISGSTSSIQNGTSSTNGTLSNGNGSNPFTPDPSGLSGSPVNGMFFFHHDHLGSVSMVTDSNGNAANGGDLGGKVSLFYEPYGEIDRTNSTGPDIFRNKFLSKPFDPESGLHFLNSRYYDPVLGRFTSPDVLLTDDVMGADLYAYANGNPVTFHDASGFRKMNDVLAGFVKDIQQGILEIWFQQDPVATALYVNHLNQEAKRKARDERHRNLVLNVVIVVVAVVVTFITEGLAAPATQGFIAGGLDGLSTVFGSMTLVKVLKSFVISQLVSYTGRLIGGYSRGHTWSSEGAARGEEIAGYADAVFGITDRISSMLDGGSFFASPSVEESLFSNSTQMNTNISIMGIQSSWTSFNFQIPIGKIGNKLFNLVANYGPKKIITYVPERTVAHLKMAYEGNSVNYGVAGIVDKHGKGSVGVYNKGKW